MLLLSTWEEDASEVTVRRPAAGTEITPFWNPLDGAATRAARIVRLSISREVVR